DTKNVFLTKEASTSLAFVQLSETGDRDFSFYRDPGADTQIRFEDVNKEDIANAKVLCFGSLLLTAEPARTAVPQIVKFARENGVITAYDPNWRQPLWPDDETGIKAMKSLLPFADVVKAADEELEMLTGCASIEDGAKALFELGVQVVVVTRGAKGCVVCAKEGTVALPTYDTKVIDTTGSGDSFFGAFLTKLMETGKPVAELTLDELCAAAKFGNAAGSVCATKKGAIPALPDYKSIEDCMGNTPLLIL
ncbi:MAG: carbohydrate kinase, partial [Clostridia bacterium]|nr:carbohydrate kinase [Clostridia bacterium]